MNRIDGGEFMSILHFEHLVERFKNNEFGIEELQSRLNTAPAPQPFMPEFSNKLYELENELERILYTQLEINHYQLARDILDAFIDSIKKLY